MRRFTFDVARSDDEARLELGGELDMAATLRLEPAVEQLLGEGVRRLVIDLGGLSFIDSTGFSLLVAVTEQARRAGAELVLLRPRADVGRALQMTGLDTVLPLADAPSG
jgi:anti-sigma B factor antagonist